MSSSLIPFSEVKDMALSVAKSGLYGLKSQEQVMTLMLISQSENIHPMRALAIYDIINGKPALKSAEILARFQQSGGSVEWVETSDKKATGKFSHPQGGSITVEWNLKRATDAGFGTKDNYKKFPAQMFRSRCISEAVRAIYPMCLNSMYSTDELQDAPQSSMPNFDHIGGTEYTEAEIEPTVNDLKQLLAKALKELGFNNAMIKEFAEMYKLNEDESLLLDIATNKDTLLEAVKKFEDGEK